MELKNFLFLISVLLILLVNAVKSEHLYVVMAVKSITPSGNRPGSDGLWERSDQELVEMCRRVLSLRKHETMYYRLTGETSMGPLSAYDVVYNEGLEGTVSAYQCPIQPALYLYASRANPDIVHVIVVRYPTQTYSASCGTA